MSHSFRQHWEEVDSRLLVVGSQTGSLTPGPSFVHNLGYRCPNGPCKAILCIYTSRTFHWYKENPNVRCFDPWTRTLSFRESWRTPTSHFWGCEFHPHTYPKVGLWHSPRLEEKVNVLIDNFFLSHNYNCFLLESLAICRLLRLRPCLKLT
jgi:hypothetical protein